MLYLATIANYYMRSAVGNLIDSLDSCINNYHPLLEDICRISA